MAKLGEPASSAGAGVGTTPISRARGQAEVVDRIKEHILEQRLAPGDPLPTESELCAAIGASRSSVREAVKTLRALDIVDVRHGHGTYVGRMSLNALVESLAFRGLLSRSDEHRVLEQVIEVRRTLEQGMAAQIIEGLDGRQRENLYDVAREMQDLASRGEDFLEQDRTFHVMLLEPLGNDLVLQLTEAFWDVQRIVTPTLGSVDLDLVTSADAHVAIVDAAAAADPARMHDAIAEHYAPLLARIAALREQ
ncbi:MAG TPA: GntR family transcriptional regulator [Segeticoccus sp.]|uniref:FadR/GntR family transcriptional regulator n=1 Tax=Segeticoccus sp. TaxID=2706531 RepID=UPI002D801895|nr:GntR family transcriptional regulator [Segeticoccus sp.]HET8600594.1 GntR family transcriptional regulator [Segeticoccus sp.]